jgi:endonuclease-3
VHRRLRAAQGPFEPKPSLDPLDELVLTVLSQNTSDVNRDRAFAGLKERFPTWNDVWASRPGALADAIRPGGIANVKGQRIKAILDEIRRREGKLSLKGLEKMSDAEVSEYLATLPGVGPKTIACVLVFSLGRPAFPIDTHVHRIAGRLGWIDRKLSADKAHDTLGPRVPPDIRYDLHVALIEHGRTICVARNPRCTACVLLDLCPAGQEFLATRNGTMNGSCRSTRPAPPLRSPEASARR